MSIFPLPQFEADLEEQQRADAEAYAALSAPKTMVLRFGAMRFIAELPYDGDAKPGCGSKLVARTHRGTEIGEMLTSTCPNAGCSKSVTRKEMLEYIDRSGGADYPFFEDGRVLRVATVDDMQTQERLDEDAPAMARRCQELADGLDLGMNVVKAEPILGGELLTFYFTADGRVDFRELLRHLARAFSTRIELRQIGARDEARLIADYERCGQHCCCKQFLKVLKPVSMRSAKTQKATLDPLKISGRCGRLMCCLRYEDQTYDDLRKRLPRRKARVRTPMGVGTVLDTQILTQLVLVRLDERDATAAGVVGGQAAVPVEEIEVLPRDAPSTAPARGKQPPDKRARDSQAKGKPARGKAGKPQSSADAADDPLRGATEAEVRRKLGSRDRGDALARQDAYRDAADQPHRDAKSPPDVGSPPDAEGTEASAKSRPSKPRKKVTPGKGRSGSAGSAKKRRDSKKSADDAGDRDRDRSGGASDADAPTKGKSSRRKGYTPPDLRRKRNGGDDDAD